MHEAASGSNCGEKNAGSACLLANKTPIKTEGLRFCCGGAGSLDGVRNALLKLAADYNSELMIVVDRLMRWTERVRAAKPANHLQEEQAVFEALGQLWPRAKTSNALRIVAMFRLVPRLLRFRLSSAEPADKRATRKSAD